MVCAPSVCDLAPKTQHFPPNTVFPPDDSPSHPAPGLPFSVNLCALSCVRLCTTPRTAAHSSSVHEVLQARILKWVQTNPPTSLRCIQTMPLPGSKDFQNFPGLTYKYPSLWAWTQRGTWEVGCVTHLDLVSSSSGLPSLPYHSQHAQEHTCMYEHIHTHTHSHTHTTSSIGDSVSMGVSDVHQQNVNRQCSDNIL